MNPQYAEILLSVAYMVFLFLLFLAVVNWPTIRNFFTVLHDIALAVMEAYCEYEEEFQKLSPEERMYLQQDVNLFI